MVNNENPFNRTPSFLSKVFYLPEDLEFIQLDMTLRQFVKQNSPFYTVFDHKKCEAIVKDFDIDANKKLNKLSHGQTKKAAIAFALATNADLLLMDEPSNGLDIPSKTMFRKVMAEYCNDETCSSMQVWRQYHKNSTSVLKQPFLSTRFTLNPHLVAHCV